MIKVEIIGNLGADAELKDYNGSKFVSFRVAHTDKYTDRKSGEIVSTTTWASCILNGENRNLMPYLKKGAKVFVRGNLSFHIYSSSFTKSYEVSMNVNVWELELCGGRQEQPQAQPTEPGTQQPQNNDAPF